MRKNCDQMSRKLRELLRKIRKKAEISVDNYK